MLSGDYLACLSAYNSGGCPAEYCVQLHVELIPAIDVPNAFSPNGDGANDYWQIKGIEYVKDLDIMIYDRFGKLIAHRNENNLGWDGTYNSMSLPSSDYWFTINYTEDGVAKEYKSHFSLIR